VSVLDNKYRVVLTDAHWIFY